jgi:hypothetical protein
MRRLTSTLVKTSLKATAFAVSSSIETGHFRSRYIGH